MKYLEKARAKELLEGIAISNKSKHNNDFLRKIESLSGGVLNLKGILYQ